MLELALKSLIAYLLGTLLGSLILGRLKGVDIRSMGSGNAGATNALRTQGRAFGLSVLILDIGKGVLAVSWVPALILPGVDLDPQVSRQGVATVVGVIGALDPRLLVPLFSCWFIVVLLTGYVGLASMLAGVGLSIAVYRFDPGNTPLLEFCILVTAFVIYTHRSNLARMAAGTEGRARRLWLFRSRAV